MGKIFWLDSKLVNKVGDKITAKINAEAMRLKKKKFQSDLINASLCTQKVYLKTGITN